MTFTLSDLVYLAPEALLLMAAAITLLLDVFNVDERLQTISAAVGAAAALLLGLPAASALDPSKLPAILQTMLVLDTFAIFFKAMLLITLLSVLVASTGYFGRFSGHKGEYVLMLLLATTGMMRCNTRISRCWCCAYCWMSW